MKRKLLFAALCVVSVLGLRAQTNLIAGWDGGNDTSSPSNFGWTSSANRTLQPRNNNGGIRMMTTYSDYKLENGTAYSYSASSDPSSVIFWLRYNTAGESFTYTFQGLEPDVYYDFSALIGWHNNSSNPTFTVKVNDGSSDLATMTKAVSAKQTLYSVSARFKTSSTMTTTTNVKIVFTCNQTGDCMEAISALKLVNVLVKDDLQAAILYATRVNTTLNNSTLTSSIATAQGVYDNASATQAQINGAASTLNSAVATALGEEAPADMTFVIANPGFESCAAISNNQATGTSQDYSSTYWTALSTATSNSCGAVVAYGSSYTLNNVTAPSKDNNNASGNALGISIGWSATVAYQSSAVTLPAGSYTMTVYGYNNNPEGANFTSKNGFITSSNSYLSTKTSFTNGTWETDVITFSLTEPITGVFQIGGTAGNNTSGTHAKVFFDNITLSFTDPLKASKDALEAEIDKAKLCDAKEGLASAISTAEGVLASATTISELEEALATLQAADKDAVLRYENGLADATSSAPVVTSFVVNGTFDDSNISMWSCNNSFQNKDRKTTNDDNAGNMNNSKPWWENWNASALVNKMCQTINNIPNGTYRLDITAFVNNFDAESQYVFANSNKTPLTSDAQSGATYEVYTVVTNNQIEVGLEQTAATANWMGIDNVSLRYYGAGDVITDAQGAAHKLAWQEAKAAAEAAFADAAYENVTGSEKTALQTEIAKAEPSDAAGYDDAADALNTAKQTFVNAKTSYDIFVTYNTTLAYADSNKKPAITSESTAASIMTALRAYYESHALAENVTAAMDMTSSIANPAAMDANNGWSWSGTKNDPKNNEPWTDALGSSSHWYFDGGNWNADSWTTTMSQDITLPAGTYLLTAKGRAATNTTLTLEVGTESVELPHVGSTGNVFDRGWGDASLVFTTDGSGITILVTATSSTIHEWFSIADFRLVSLTDLTVPATIASSGYSTIASAYALDCANLPAGLKAYKVSTLTASEVTLQEVTEAVAAGTGLILEGTASTAYDIPVAASGNDISGTNLLKAAVTATPIDANTAYILQGGQFHLVTAASEVPAGKAYLLASDLTSARSLNIVFEDGADGIESIQDSKSEIQNAIFDLSGRRVSKAQKGIYIVNGKKVIK